MFYWLSQAAAASTLTAGQIVEPVPAGSIAITGFAPGVSQNTNKVIEPVPPAYLTISGSAPATRLRLRERPTAGTLLISSYAPSAYQNTAGKVVEPVPAGQIRISSVAPSVRTKQRTRIPPATLTFTELAPVVRTRVVKRPPSARVVVSGVVPKAIKRIYKKPPASNIYLSAYTPNAGVRSPGVERIPPGYLRLVSNAPGVRVNGKQAEKQAGGGRRAVQKRRIMIGRRWYWVQSRHEEILLLQRYLRQKELELAKEQAKRNGPAKRRKIKAIAMQIARTKTRITKAQTGDAWEEEEELLLMLIA